MMPEEATNKDEQQAGAVADLELSYEQADGIQAGTETPKTSAYSIVIDRRPAL